MGFHEKESPHLTIGNPRTKITKFVARVRTSWEQPSLQDLNLPKYNESMAEILGQQTRHIGIFKKPSYARFGDLQLPKSLKTFLDKNCVPKPG